MASLFCTSTHFARRKFSPLLTRFLPIHHVQEASPLESKDRLTLSSMDTHFQVCLSAAHVSPEPSKFQHLVQVQKHSLEPLENALGCFPNAAPGMDLNWGRGWKTQGQEWGEVPACIRFGLGASESPDRGQECPDVHTDSA